MAILCVTAPHVFCTVCNVNLGSQCSTATYRVKPLFDKRPISHLTALGKKLSKVGAIEAAQSHECELRVNQENRCGSQYTTWGNNGGHTYKFGAIEGRYTVHGDYKLTCPLCRLYCDSKHAAVHCTQQCKTSIVT